jgi:hypothetical protein
VILGVATTVLIGTGGCTLHDPYRTQTGTTAANAEAGGQTTAVGPGLTGKSNGKSPATRAPDPAAEPPAAAAAPGTPANVLYHFALAFGNVSAANPEQRQAALAALATPAFAGTLTVSSADAQFQNTRGLPPGGSIVAQVESVQLDPPQGSFDHGAVTLLSALRNSGGSTDPPASETYVADLLKTSAGWQVAAYTFLP